jgi:hypothetical protein
MKHIEKIEALFDEKFDNLYDIICFGTEDFKYQHHNVKSFLRTSHTSFITDLIQKVEGEKLLLREGSFGRGRGNTSPKHKEIQDIMKGDGYNDEFGETIYSIYDQALDTIIKMLREEME